MKKNVVMLTGEERSELESVVRKGFVAGWKSQRARALLAFDQGEGGPLSLLERKAQERPARRRLGGEEEARLVALACSAPPEGAARWTLRLLAGRLVELEVVGEVSHETVRRALKKTRSSPGAA